jgi:two-component system LytT family response regulator
MKVRTLIVDDEPLARERLRQLLAAAHGIEVVGECAGGGEAVRAIQNQSPDLVFLDVQMPELDGFGVIEAVGAERMPLVVFVTAHDRYALKAFEVHAVDYLLKPFDRERFQKALARALERLQRHDTAALSQRLSAMLAELRPEARQPGRLAVKTEGRVLLLKVDDIDWIESADNYVGVHVGPETHLLRETMNAMESRLPAERFLRISRSAIVNVERIRELQPMFHGEYVVILRNGTRLMLSRTYREKLQQILGKLG